MDLMEALSTGGLKCRLSIGWVQSPHCAPETWNILLLGPWISGRQKGSSPRKITRSNKPMTCALDAHTMSHLSVLRLSVCLSVLVLRLSAIPRANALQRRFENDENGYRWLFASNDGPKACSSSSDI
jgi:hypothetical protein